MDLDRRESLVAERVEMSRNVGKLLKQRANIIDEIMQIDTDLI